MKTPIRLIIILAWAVTLSVASYGCMKANDWQAAETDGTDFAKKLRGCRMDERVNRNIQLTDDADDSATEDQE